MASVGFGSRVAAAAVTPSSSTAGRRRPSSRVGMVVVGATRGQPAPAEEKSIGDFIFGVIFKKDQLVETDPLLNKVDGAASSSGSTAIRRPPVGGKKPAPSSDEDGGGGFNFGSLFAKKG